MFENFFNSIFTQNINLKGFENHAHAMPEIFLALAAMALVVFGAFKKESNTVKFQCIMSKSVIAVMLLAAFFILQNSDRFFTTEQIFSFNNLFYTNFFSSIAKLFILSAAILILMINFSNLKFQEETNKFEFPIIFLFSTIAMMLLVSSNNFMSLYMAIEMQSLSFYVMAAYNRSVSKSSEAGLKYFILGALSSGFLLFGISLIYGYVGSLDFGVLKTYFASSEKTEVAVLVGLIFVLVSFLFKISAAPFHMWTPDVYEGSPLIVTTIFSTIPKIAVLFTLMNLLFGVFPLWNEKWQQIMIFASVLSMLVGSFGALMQNNLKRLLAYGSIAHMGFLLLGFASGNIGSISSIILYLTIYVAMSLGAFALIHNFNDGKNKFENIEDLAGISKTNPIFSLLMLVTMFSMAGIPPFAGFFAKYYIIMTVIAESHYILAFIAACASVISAYYYLKIVKIIYFDEKSTKFTSLKASANLSLNFVISLTFAINLFYFIKQDEILKIAMQAKQFFLS